MMVIAMTVGWYTCKEVVCPERTSSWVTLRFHLRAGTSGGLKMEPKLRCDLVWERKGRLREPKGRWFKAFLPQREAELPITILKPPMMEQGLRDLGAQTQALWLLGKDSAPSCIRAGMWSGVLRSKE